ncbi:MAG: hypothetical protein AAF585_23540 [Verrucomicrobiota bacterium]
MKLSKLIVLTACSCGILHFACGEETETRQSAADRYEVERYSELWKNSMFHSKTRQATERSDWILAGVFEIDGERGATVINRNTGVAEMIAIDDESQSGIRLVQIQKGRDSSDLSAEIEIRGERRWIRHEALNADPAQGMAERSPAPKPAKKPLALKQ